MAFSKNLDDSLEPIIVIPASKAKPYVVIKRNPKISEVEEWVAEDEEQLKYDNWLCNRC